MAEDLTVTRKGFGSYVRDRPPLRRVSSTHRHASHRASGKPLEPGVPMVRMLHIDYDPDGRTLQVADDPYAGDRHEFAFEWAEQDGTGSHE